MATQETPRTAHRIEPGFSGETDHAGAAHTDGAPTEEDFAAARPIRPDFAPLRYTLALAIISLCMIAFIDAGSRPVEETRLARHLTADAALCYFGAPHDPFTLQEDGDGALSLVGDRAPRAMIDQMAEMGWLAPPQTLSVAVGQFAQEERPLYRVTTENAPISAAGICVGWREISNVAVKTRADMRFGEELLRVSFDSKIALDAWYLDVEGDPLQLNAKEGRALRGEAVIIASEDGLRTVMARY